MLSAVNTQENSFSSYEVQGKEGHFLLKCVNMEKMVMIGELDIYN